MLQTVRAITGDDLQSINIGYITTLLGCRHSRRHLMRGETKERWKELCELATIEQDPEKLFELIREVNRLLEEKRARVSERAPDNGAQAKTAS